MKYLLDVNLLIALLDSNHEYHSLTIEWLINNKNNQLLVCPITQNGCIRILSLSSYPNKFKVEEVVNKLRELIASQNFKFIEDNLDILESNTINWLQIQGSKQITDAYLLALATKNNSALATLDKKIELQTVKTAKRNNLVVLI